MSERNGQTAGIHRQTHLSHQRATKLTLQHLDSHKKKHFIREKLEEPSQRIEINSKGKGL